MLYINVVSSVFAIAAQSARRRKHGGVDKLVGELQEVTTTTNNSEHVFLEAMLIVFFLIFQICAFHQGVSFSLRVLPQGSPVRGIGPWVALPIKGERSGPTRLSFPALRLSFLLHSSGEPCR